MERDEELYLMAAKCHNKVLEMIREMADDAAMGIAVSQLVGSWLVGSAMAQTLVRNKELMGLNSVRVGEFENVNAEVGVGE